MSAKYKLKYPKTFDGKEVTEIEMRRVCVLDLELMGNEQTELMKSVRLLSQVTELTMDEVRALDAYDFDQASEVVAGFLDSEQTGSSPSLPISQ